MPGASCGRRDEVVRLESDLPYPETIARPSSLPDETSRCEREGLPYRPGFDKKALKPDYSKYPLEARAPGMRAPGCAGVSPAHSWGRGRLGARASRPQAARGACAWVRRRLAHVQRCAPQTTRHHSATSARAAGSAGVSPACGAVTHQWSAGIAPSDADESGTLSLRGKQRRWRCASLATQFISPQ